MGVLSFPQCFKLKSQSCTFELKLTHTCMVEKEISFRSTKDDQTIVKKANMLNMTNRQSLAMLSENTLFDKKSSLHVLVPEKV